MAFDACVKLYKTSGKLVKSNTNTFKAGTSNFELNLENLSTGLYMLFIESENGTLNKKVVVIR